jgi:hypothetical protein
MTLAVLAGGSAANAQDATWHVNKSSGEVWFTASGAQPVTLSNDSTLKPGDIIRTGADGRVLLVRGAETMLVSPNTVVGLPLKQQDGLSTTILQRAGTILLDVEKRNVQHFEVATPFLAAVVKGTQFRVTVGENRSQVDVLRGQVQVSDYRTGQYALVNPQQSAQVSLTGPSGVALSGPGPLNPIQFDRPREPLVKPLTVVADNQTTAPVTSAPAAPLVIQTPGPSYAATHPAETTSDDLGFASSIVVSIKEMFGIKGAKGRDDDLAIVLALPAFVGFSVAVGAAALRRKRKRT